jgi:hypothetical protein
MYLGEGKSVQLYSQWVSDGDVEVVKASHQAELSKIKFEKTLLPPPREYRRTP